MLFLGQRQSCLSAAPARDSAPPGVRMQHSHLVLKPLPGAWVSLFCLCRASMGEKNASLREITCVHLYTYTCIHARHKSERKKKRFTSVWTVKGTVPPYPLVRLHFSGLTYEMGGNCAASSVTALSNVPGYMHTSIYVLKTPLRRAVTLNQNQEKTPIEGVYKRKR